MAPLTVCIVGGGLAGSTTAYELAKFGQDIEVIVVDDDPHGPYDKPPLTKRLLDQDFELDAEPVWAVSEVTWLRDRVTGIDPEARVATLRSGRELSWDHLVLASGGRPRAQSREAHGFSVLRTAADAVAVRDLVRDRRLDRVVIEGAGPVGCELATTLARQGLAVTVVEADRLPMRRLLGPDLGAMVAGWALEAGVDLRLERHITTSSPPDERPHRITLSDGDVITAGLGVTAIGMVPADELVATWASTDGRGVHCDPTGRVVASDGEVFDRVWAVGDVAAHTDAATGALVHLESWTNATEQGTAVAAAILNRPSPARERPYFWTDVFGRRVQVLGAVPSEERSPVRIADYPERRGAVYRFDDTQEVPVAWVAINAPRDFARISREEQLVRATT